MQIGVAVEARTLREAVDGVRRAEEQGFAVAAFANIFGLDAMTACAIAGQATERIVLGTAVVPTFPRHPFVMAQQAASTHDACDGRFTLGIGLSHQPVVEMMWGLSFAQPVSHAREYVTIVRALLDGESVAHSGKHYRVNGQLQRPRDDRPDILLAALGPKMLRVAGELADGTVTWMCGERTLAEHIVPTITKAAQATGRKQPRVSAGAPVCVTADEDAARDRANREFSMYGRLASYRAMLDREGAENPGDVAIVGDETAVAATINRLAEAGVTEIGAWVYGDTGDRARTYEALAAIARA